MEKKLRTKEKLVTVKEISVSYKPEIYKSYGDMFKVSKDNFPSLKPKIDKLLQTRKSKSV